MSRLDAMAQHMWDARRARQKYANLPDDLKPGSIAEAYRRRRSIIASPSRCTGRSAA